MNNTSEELYAIESKQTIILEMRFATRLYRMIFEVIADGDMENGPVTIYSHTKKTFYNVENGITPMTKSEEKSFANVSTIDGAMHKMLQILRINGYHLVSPKKK